MLLVMILNMSQNGTLKILTKATEKPCVLIMITGTIGTAVDAVKKGCTKNVAKAARSNFY